MAATALMISVTMAIMMLLLNPTGCDAFASFKPLLNNETSREGKYLVGDKDIDSEFLMESHISRILVETQNFETSSTDIPEEPSTPECGRPPRYDSCLGEKRNKPPPENCGPFNRENPC